MSQSSSSSQQISAQQPQQKSKPLKLFVTNLDVEIHTSKLQSQLRQKFTKYGKIESIVVKKSFNDQYSYAFIEYKDGQKSQQVINQLNNTNLLGKKMKVELQDNARRRKGGSQSCFTCGKPGHYSRNCRQKQKDKYDRSDSESSQRRKKKSKKHKKHKQKQRSSSRDSSRDEKKKHKKKHSKKIKKSKHKKRRDSDDSDSSA